MGLDIFAYRIKNSAQVDTTNRLAICSYLKEDARQTLSNQFEKMLKNLNRGDYNKAYIAFCRKLSKLQCVTEYDLRQFGYDKFYDIVNEVKPVEIVKQLLDKLLKDSYPMYDTYFRKVNFIYQYFLDVKTDEEWCIVDRERIKNLITLCENVLDYTGDEDYAQEHLPTRAGFFFGSTEYNEHYWLCVKGCLKEMKKLYKTMEEDDLVYWEFSW